MNTIDQDWLKLKRLELWNAEDHFGEIVKTWDLCYFLRIIDERDREIRRLKTALGAK